MDGFVIDMFYNEFILYIHINSLNVDQTSEDIHSFNATVLFRMVKRWPHSSGDVTNDPYISKLAVISN